MTHWSDEKTDVAAAVRARLLDLSKERGSTFDALAVRFATERLLYRLSCSSHDERFVLKGAWLFHLWGISRRTTRDVDLLGYGEDSVDAMERVLRDVCAQEVEPDDGLHFDPGSIDSREQRAKDRYAGVRIRMSAFLGSAEIRLQVDVGFGDPLAEHPIESEVPVLLGYPSPTMRAYPAEAAVAEKTEAIVRFGARNSRMKDFFDLLVLARERTFDGPLLARQMEATFSRRGTPLPGDLPVGLTDGFGEQRNGDWKAFLRSSKGEGVPDEFPRVVRSVREFVGPPLRAIAEGSSWELVWEPSGTWSTRRDGGAAPGGSV